MAPSHIYRETFPVGPLACNCTIIGNTVTKEAIVIDPGGDAQRILDEVRRLGLTIKYVIDTHGHFDHILANGEVMAALQAAQDTPPLLAIHSADAPLLTTGGGAAWFGIRADPSPPADVELGEGPWSSGADAVCYKCHEFGDD